MRLIERAGLPVVGPNLGADRYLEWMRGDKKSEAGEIRFVTSWDQQPDAVRPLAEAIGRL